MSGHISALSETVISECFATRSANLTVGRIFPSHFCRRRIQIGNTNNMFPVPDNEYTYVDIPKVKNPQYRKLLTTEYRIIRKLQDKIKNNAEEVYKHKINKDNVTALAKRCNDFILLEEKCKQFELSS